MTPDQLVARGTFLADMGRGAFALAVISTAAACAPTAMSTASGASASHGSSPGSSGSSSGGAGASPSDPNRGGASDPPSSDAEAVTWARVNLGFVSAYILVRGGEAAIVDTGIGGSIEAIETSLRGTGLDWAAVGHLILTHKHGDHVGSAADVLARAPDAVAYAGREDIGAMTLPKPLTAVGDGDRVFDLTIITTPGHTPGSISVWDPVGGLVVAGDALRTDAGRPAMPGARFTEDLDLARRSIAKLGQRTFETLLVGHGEPITTGASAAVAQLGSLD